MNGKIYVVEDDESIGTLLSLSLKTLDYEITVFDSGERMFEQLQKEIPDLFFLDIMLPGESGFQILQKLKDNEKWSNIPVIFLTAKSNEADKVLGLESGAEDYITKPFSVLELLSRTKKILSRIPASKENIVQYKDLKIYTDMLQVFKNDTPIELTIKEYKLLMYLLENRGRVILRNELLDKLWGINFEGETRTLDMHIKTLRAKLRDDAENPNYIKTVRGAGYTIL